MKSTEASEMGGHFRIIEAGTDQAEFLAGDLFLRVFGHPLPNYPRHFVCLHRADNGIMRTAGYVHFSRFESVHLVGGLVVDRALYGDIPAEHLEELAPCRSVGEYLMKEGIHALPDSAAVFAYMGDRRSIEVNERVGYVRTHLENLYAYWRQDVPPDLRRLLAERVMRVAPF
jgi:hypothetical protein